MSEKDMTDDISTSFKSISHPIRVHILLMLAERMQDGYAFGDLSRALSIESSGKLAFHLDKLGDLLEQEDDGRYYLNEKGRKAVQAIQILGVRGDDNSDFSQPPDVKDVDEINDEINHEDQVKLDPLESYSFKRMTFLNILYSLFFIAVPSLFTFFITEVFSITIEGRQFISILAFSFFTILGGIFFYFHARREKSHQAMKDIGKSALLSFTSIAIVGSVLIGRILSSGGSIYPVIFWMILIYCGVWVADAITKEGIVPWQSILFIEFFKNWKNTVPLVLLVISNYQFAERQIYTEKLYASDGQGGLFVYSSSSFFKSSSEIGVIAMSALLLSLFLMFLLSSQKSSKLVVRKRWLAVSFLLVVLLLLMIFLSMRVLYEAVFSISKSDGYFMLWIDILSAVLSLLVVYPARNLIES